MQKKGRKYIFNFEIHTKKYQKGKKESTFIWIFSLLYPLCIFLHFKPKNSYKKDKNTKKKQKKFQIAKRQKLKKKQKIIFKKKDAKKQKWKKKDAKKSRNAKKKMQKKSMGGVSLLLFFRKFW